MSKQYFVSEQNVVSENIGVKNLWSKEFLGPRKFGGTRNLWLQNILVQILGLEIVGCKRILVAGWEQGNFYNIHHKVVNFAR